jgi:competence protein ComEC
MKKNIKEKIFNAYRGLVAPLDGKPALVSALTLVATIAALDEHKYAVFLLGGVFLLTHFFRRHLQWVIFITMAAGIVVHEGILGIGGYNMEKPQIAHENGSISNSGCGKIESRLPRPKGTAFIVNVSENDDENASEVHYKVRLTEKRNLSDLPLPGIPSVTKLRGIQ